MRKTIVVAALAALIATPALTTAPAEAGMLRLGLSAPNTGVSLVAGRHGERRSVRSGRHAALRSSKASRYGYRAPSRLRSNGPQAFGYRNLSGRFTPRFNVTGRRVNSLLRY